MKLAIVFFNFMRMLSDEDDAATAAVGRVLRVNRSVSAMATADVVMTLLMTLTITSSVTCVGLYHSPDDVSQLAAAADDAPGAESEVMARRTPGWGKRRDHDSLLHFPDKRRGWGKRDADNDCVYWRSLLHFVKVNVDSILSQLPHKFE